MDVGRVAVDASLAHRGNSSHGKVTRGMQALAGFNGIELLAGLPMQLATTDACRREIGMEAAKMILNASSTEPDPDMPKAITMKPKLTLGDTLRRRKRG